MKIAFVLDHFPALSETFILNQITGLIDRGHQVDIFAKRKVKNFSKYQPEVWKYNLMSRSRYFEIPKTGFWRISKAMILLAKYLPQSPEKILKSLNFFKYGKMSSSLKLLYICVVFLKEDFDIIHCQFGPIGVLGVFLKDMGVIDGKVITSFRGYDLSKDVRNKNKKEYSFLFSKGDLFLPVCHFFKKILVQMGCNQKKIIVHHSGTNLSLFECKNKYQKTTELADRQLTLLTVCRLVEKKGVEYSLKAVHRIIQMNSDIEIRYLIIGSGWCEKELRRLVFELGLTDRVSFLGRKKQDQIAEIMRRSDILLSSNITSSKEGYDGIPGVIREAMACCLPVCAAKTGGIPEIIIDSQTGFLFPEKNIDVLTEKIQYLISNPGVREKIGKNARRHIEKYYDIDSLNDNLAKIYAGLIDGVDSKEVEDRCLENSFDKVISKD